MPDLEQTVPEQVPQTEPVAVIDERDFTRLDVKAFQQVAFEDTGEYIQVGINQEFIDGDIATFNVLAVDVVKPNQEIHVYDAPCGRGWQLIIHDESLYVEKTQFDIEGNIVPAFVPIQRSYGYGCESADRTFNW